MCGIAGYYLPSNIISNNNLFDHSLINKKIINSMIHRGPDDYGIFREENLDLSLFHTRLSILDLSQNGHQPIFDNNGNFVLIFNGEIYNYKEIKLFLDENYNISWKGKSDTEVLLNLLSLMHDENLSKTKILRKINGIFSFAVWDKKNKELLIARDPFGVKPLYYVDSEEIFAFASELKSILPLFKNEYLNKKLEISNTSINRYLSFLWCPGKGTPFKKIKKLEPGTYLRIKNGQIIEENLWYKLPLIRNRNRKYISKDHAIKYTEINLRKAVHRQLISDVPVGAFLSGGLDSSSIAAFAREVNPKLECFTIKTKGNNENGRIKDLPYAEKVANHLSLSLKVVEVNPDDIIKEIKNMVWQLDEPVADPAALNVFFISQFAKSNGIKVLLSGTGSDDLFTGYRRHLSVEYEKFWNWLPTSFLRSISNNINNLSVHNALFRRIRKTFSMAHLKGDVRLINYFKFIDDKDLRKLYSRDFFKEINSKAEEPMLEFMQNLPHDLNRLERMLSLEQRFFLTDHNLNYTDKMSMKTGIEVRVPFLDLELVEFANQIPRSLKQRNGHSKWILKKTMEPYLPREIIYRPKTGFGVPLRRWLNFELKDWLCDTLSIERLNKRGFFNPKAVHNLINANQKNEIDASFTLLSLACVEIWCQKFVDG